MNHLIRIFFIHTIEHLKKPFPYVRINAVAIIHYNGSDPQVIFPYQTSVKHKQITMSKYKQFDQSEHILSNQMQNSEKTSLLTKQRCIYNQTCYLPIIPKSQKINRPPLASSTAIFPGCCRSKKVTQTFSRRIKHFTISQQ